MIRSVVAVGLAVATTGWIAFCTAGAAVAQEYPIYLRCTISAKLSKGGITSNPVAMPDQVYRITPIEITPWDQRDAVWRQNWCTSDKPCTINADVIQQDRRDTDGSSSTLIISRNTGSFSFELLSGGYVYSQNGSCVKSTDPSVGTTHKF